MSTNNFCVFCLEKAITAFAAHAFWCGWSFKLPKFTWIFLFFIALIDGLLIFVNFTSVFCFGVGVGIISIFGAELNFFADDKKAYDASDFRAHSNTGLLSS